MEAIIAGYILVGLIATRWSVGLFLKKCCYGDDLYLEEVAMAWLIAIGTVALWPLAIPAVLGRGAWWAFSHSPLKSWVRWFYTLDRDERKAILR